LFEKIIGMHIRIKVSGKTRVYYVFFRKIRKIWIYLKCPEKSNFDEKNWGFPEKLLKKFFFLDERKILCKVETSHDI